MLTVPDAITLVPRYFEISKKKRLSVKWQGYLQLTGVCLLFLIVPFRHVLRQQAK